MANPSIHWYDCGHGRTLKVVLTEREKGPTFAFLVFADEQRNHDLLCWRDNPSITLPVEERQLLSVVVSFVKGEVTGERLGALVCLISEKCRGSEWRRAVVGEFCRAAVRFDPAKRLQEAMGYGYGD